MKASAISLTKFRWFEALVAFGQAFRCARWGPARSSRYTFASEDASRLSGGGEIVKAIEKGIRSPNWQPVQFAWRGSLLEPVGMALIAVVLPCSELVAEETTALEDYPAVRMSCETVSYRLGTNGKDIVEANRQTLEAQLCAGGFSVSVFTDPGLNPVEKIGFASNREIWSLLNGKLHVADVVDGHGVVNRRSAGELQQYAMQMKLLGFAKPLVGALTAVGFKSPATLAIREFVDEFAPATAPPIALRSEVHRAAVNARVPIEITTLATINSMELPISKLTCTVLEGRSTTSDCEMPTAGFVGSPLIFKNGTALVDGNPIKGMQDASSSTFVRGMIILLALLPLPLISLVYWKKRRKPVNPNHR